MLATSHVFVGAVSRNTRVSSSVTSKCMQKASNWLFSCEASDHCDTCNKKRKSARFYHHIQPHTPKPIRGHRPELCDTRSTRTESTGDEANAPMAASFNFSCELGFSMFVRQCCIAARVETALAFLIGEFLYVRRFAVAGGVSGM